VPARLPTGDPAPADGGLPTDALRALGRRPFGVYVHVPFCTTRCGYCDFNTYTPREAGGGDATEAYVEAAVAEVRFAARVLGPGRPAAATVHLGGGTPTVLTPTQLGRILTAVRDELGVRPDAEITLEANPESVDPASLAALRAAGFDRISLGMQSAAPHVLATLDRAHTPGRAAAAALEARAAGFAVVGLDLILGTPGETDEDWARTVDAALATGPDRLSVYALTVEPGTALAARVRRGVVPSPDPDAAARRYEHADAALAAAGLHWYELANWSTGPATRSAHNHGYWVGSDWWGIGPGAHSHVAGVRWWNVLRPASHARALAEGRSPAAGRETLDDETRRVERVMLELRLVEGLPTDLLLPAGRAAADRAADAGLLDAGALHRDGRCVLTLPGRLVADALTRDLVD
jgi:putative oxygen-independent coproporphyrinogen III oxidase